jgi:hypothetical protein
MMSCSPQRHAVLRAYSLICACRCQRRWFCTMGYTLLTINPNYTENPSLKPRYREFSKLAARPKMTGLVAHLAVQHFLDYLGQSNNKSLRFRENRRGFARA